MGFEKPKPKVVRDAIDEGDTRKLQTLGRAGAKKRAKNLQLQRVLRETYAAADADEDARRRRVDLLSALQMIRQRGGDPVDHEAESETEPATER
jgi:hypothetical protein